MMKLMPKMKLIMHQYSKSLAPQHHRLLATAATMRSILSSESLPLSPSAYFAATIFALDDCQTLDAMAMGAAIYCYANDLAAGDCVWEGEGGSGGDGEAGGQGGIRGGECEGWRV
ncbi:hypothetical protein SLA2020_100350 [Shorea laevis]